MTENPNMAGLILEGVSGSGKSTVLEATLRSESYLDRGYLSSVVLSEHHTQRVLEAKERSEGLNVEDNVALLRQHLDVVHTMHSRLQRMQWGALGKLRHRACYAMERFHLTHVCHYEHMRWEYVKDIDEALSEIGCKLCLLRVDDGEIEERVVSLRRNQEWRAYLGSRGPTGDHLVDYYVTQQEQLLDLCEASSMPCTTINTSRKEVDEVVADLSALWLE